MKEGLMGKYFSKAYVSEENGDLFTQIKTDLGLTSLTATKLTLVVQGNTKIDINELGTYSELLLSADGNRYFSLDGADVLVRSVKTETAGITVFVAMIFNGA